MVFFLIKLIWLKFFFLMIWKPEFGFLFFLFMIKLNPSTLIKLPPFCRFKLCYSLNNLLIVRKVDLDIDLYHNVYYHQAQDKFYRYMIFPETCLKILANKDDPKPLLLLFVFVDHISIISSPDLIQHHLYVEIVIVILSE